MAQRVMLHVGVPKTGTTYLQTILWANRERLADSGVLVPGRELFDHNLASVAVRSDTPSERATRVWQRMLDESQKWPGTVVLTNEWFTLATRRQANAGIAALQPSEVHVVCTARDFVALVPAAWQEVLKLGRDKSLPEFVANLEAAPERWSWRTLDPTLVLSRWGSSLPSEQVHVVTVPPSGADPRLLWERFAAACGIDPASCDPGPAYANASLGAETARLLQLLGPQLRAAIDAEHAPWTEPYRWIRRLVGHELLVPQGGSRIRLPDADLAMLRERSASTVSALAAAGYDVIGDLDDLTSAEVHPGARSPDEVTDRELLDLAVGLVAELLSRVRLETARAETAERSLEQGPTGGRGGALARSWRAKALRRGPVKP